MHVWDSYLSLNHKVFKDCEMLNLAYDIIKSDLINHGLFPLMEWQVKRSVESIKIFYLKFMR